MNKLLLGLILFSVLPVYAAGMSCVKGHCVNGTGTKSYTNGDLYQGQWKDGKQNGRGTYYHANGDRYEGQWEDGKRKGQGTIYWAKSGNRYEGQWKDGERKGQGTLYYTNGDRYVGEYQNGQKNGQGIFYLATGDRYIGEYKSDKKNGQGSYYWANSGNRYEGQWKDGVISGQGAIYWAKSGKRYEGQFADGDLNGLGIQYSKDGSILKEGLWENNKLVVPKKLAVNDVRGVKVVSASTTSRQTIQTGQYHALIIGVEEYQHDSLTSLTEPLNDARKIKQILESIYTFEGRNVRLLSNPKRGEILDELDRLTRELSEQDNVLIFFAGHGYWDKKTERGYWLPSDARKNRRREWIPNATIASYINGIKSKHTLLISDACFSGAIFKTRKAFNDAPAATNKIYSLPSRKAMTSGTLNEEVPDKSVFMEYLTKRLQNNPNKYITSQKLFSLFSEAVINNSPTHQVPQFGVIREVGDEGGDFIFVRR